MKKLCKHNYSLSIYNHFYAILERKFWPKNFYINKNCVFLPYFDIFFWKLQLVPKENLIEFFTLCIFKIYMSNKADKPVQKCSKFVFKCFISQIVTNSTIRIE